MAQVAVCSIESNHREAKKSRNKLRSCCFRPQWRSEQFPCSQARPRRVRSYLREDLLFGKSFSRCQPAAGRTELTAHSAIPLSSSSSFFHLRPPPRLFAVSYSLASKHSSFEFDSIGLHSALCNLKSKLFGRPLSLYYEFVTTLRFDCYSLDNANWTMTPITIKFETQLHCIDIQIIDRKTFLAMNLIYRGTYL